MTTLFLVAWGLRLLFFQGCILGDDPNDIGAVQAVLGRWVHFTIHWELRIFLWFFIALAEKLFGVSEWSLFLSTWILSSSLSLLAYLTLKRFGYGPSQALLAGLFVATAPYEVLIGSLHSSDLFLEWFFALGFLVLFAKMRSQILHGALLAVVLWGARTLAGDVADSFKFVPVRRLDLFIESSITRGLQWAVFEPNGPSLWERVRTSVADPARPVSARRVAGRQA